MSFNDDATLDTSQVEAGGRGGGLPGGMLPVGGGIGGLILVVVLALLGVNGNLPGIGGDSGSSGGSGAVDLSQCKKGVDANSSATCRVVGTVNSVQAFWAGALPGYGKTYTKASTVIYSGSTQSSCGTASNDVGPFYCPLDKKVYIDPSFFDLLTQRFGADDGAFAQEYVVAHEYGHHIQDILGLLDRAQNDPKGPESGSVRIELMADCLAGVWANHASKVPDASGVTFLEPLTQKDIQSAISAAKAVGDDTIQKESTGQVNPESWTHGSSAERVKWFTNGYQNGDLNKCDTFKVSSV